MTLQGKSVEIHLLIKRILQDRVCTKQSHTKQSKKNCPENYENERKNSPIQNSPKNSPNSSMCEAIKGGGGGGRGWGWLETSMY